MSWLEKNPLGVALLGTCGLLAVVGLALTLAWRGDASSGGADIGAEGDLALPEIATARELGELGDYEVVLNRPVFNDTRRPILVEEAVPEEVAAAPEPQAVIADPPKVRLTGVVITPTERVVTLTPEAGGEALVLREGMPLDGAYVGWSVREVRPRAVSLSSARGQQLEFELAVYDTMIAKPPEPQPPAPPADASPTDGEDPALAALAGEDAATQGTRSRADEIRERIRQRREQLRTEADQQAETQAEDAEARANAYQDAIQAMIRRSNNNEEQNDSDDSGDN